MLRKIYMELALMSTELVLIRKELQSSRERLEQREKDREKRKELWIGAEPICYVPSTKDIKEATEISKKYKEEA